jgi:hypothetical protein
MASKQSGSAETGSGNAGVLYSDTGISFPLPRSVSTRSVRDIKKKKKKKDPSIFLLKMILMNC